MDKVTGGMMINMVNLGPMLLAFAVSIPMLVGVCEKYPADSTWIVMAFGFVMAIIVGIFLGLIV